MAIAQTDCKTVWKTIENNPNAVLIDVRTVEEFTAGHPEKALNIPIMLRHAASGQMLPNSDFDHVVGQHVGKDKNVYLTCRSGQRSFMAAMRLEAIGYASLCNVDGGFGGSATAAGWQDSGLPISHDNGPGVSYESLAKAVK